MMDEHNNAKTEKISSNSVYEAERNLGKEALDKAMNW